jgi:hypothetical protein
MNEQPDPRLRSPRELPQEIAPQRDLWPGIAAALSRPERAAPLSARRPPLPRYAYGLAASVALLAIGAWLGRNTLSTPNAPAAASAAATPLTAAANTSGLTMAASFALDPASKAERQRRLDALAAQLQALPPETQLKVKASLAAIEKSVVDIQNALGRDPGNLLLQEMLVNTYQDEMRVLGVVDEANRFSLEPSI